MFPKVRIQVCYRLPWLRAGSRPGLLASLCSGSQHRPHVTITCVRPSRLPLPALADSDFTGLGQGLSLGIFKSFPSDGSVQPKSRAD